MNSTDKLYGYRSYSSRKSVENKGDVLKAYMQLCKLRISAFAALSALTGSILVSAALTFVMLVTMAGIFILACGAGALNQYQERDIDALMKRTGSRPIPTGMVEKSHALYIAVSLIVTGVLIMFLSGGWTVAGLGLFAVVWYNLVYTNLKQVTAFAAVPGAIVGAIPPAIGWVAGGGSLHDYALLPICFFFFMWQVPHFWFLLFSHEEDYKTSDLPALVKIFNRDQFGRIAIIWTMATAVSLFLIPLFGIMLSDIAMFLLVIASVWIIWCGSYHVQKSNETGAHYTAFKKMNMYMLFVMAVLNIARLFNL
jgi:protoheme IX farnesyltransferase